MERYRVLIYITTLVVAPLTAVVVGQWLQNRAKKRDDKLEIVKIFVKHRGELENMLTRKLSEQANEEWYQAFNLVPVIFYNSKNVQKKFQTYQHSLPDENRDKVRDLINFGNGKNDELVKAYQNALHGFIEAMIADVGYKMFRFEDKGSMQ